MVKLSPESVHPLDDANVIPHAVDSSGRFANGLQTNRAKLAGQNITGREEERLQTRFPPYSLDISLLDRTVSSVLGEVAVVLECLSTEGIGFPFGTSDGDVRAKERRAEGVRQYAIAFERLERVFLAYRQSADSQP